MQAELYKAIRDETLTSPPHLSNENLASAHAVLTIGLRDMRATLLKFATSQQIPGPTQMINELIREYLDFNGYRDTMSVMLPETGQPVVPAFSRSFLARRLHLPETPETRRVRAAAIIDS